MKKLLPLLPSLALVLFLVFGIAYAEPYTDPQENSLLYDISASHARPELTVHAKTKGFFASLEAPIDSHAMEMFKIKEFGYTVKIDKKFDFTIRSSVHMATFGAVDDFKIVNYGIIYNFTPNFSIGTAIVSPSGTFKQDTKKFLTLHFVY
jgi:hypothetical protein